MAEVHPIIAGADRYSINVSIIVTEPLGIRKIRVFDQFGVDILSVEMGCELNATVNTGFFLRGRCPFQVEVTACENGIVTLTSPLFSADPEAEVPMPCSPLMCHENRICRERQNLLIIQRNLIDRMCEQIRRYRANERMYMALMALFYALAFLFAALAVGLSFIPYFGLLFALLFGVLAATALALAIIYNERLNRVRDARHIQEIEMDEARIRFDDIVREILANCCHECIDVDLGQPRC